MATRAELRAALDPAYWAWLQNKPRALDTLQGLIGEAVASGWTAARFLRQVQTLRSYGTWSTGGTVDEPPTEPLEEPLPDEPQAPLQGPPPVPSAFPNGDGTWTLPNGSIVDSNGDIIGFPDLLATFQNFLQENGLPITLIGFIRSALATGKPYEQIIFELRQTPEYLAAYPENPRRRDRGLAWMPEAEIRAYRNEAKRLAREYMGVDVSNEEISELISRGTSLQRWEHRLQVNDLVQRFGAGVQSVFESYTGAPLTDERLHAFMDPDFDTPEIDRIFALAQVRGIPAEYGFGIRPEEEALALEQLGIDPNKVIEGYRTIAGELPRFERLAALGGYLERNGTDFFSDISVSGSLLFRAVQFGDPEAIRELQRRVSQEAALFGGGGGPVIQGRGALTGLAL